MSSRISRLIVLFAVVQMLGGHWLALQSIAWAGMLAKYGRGESVVAAISKTFDGKHPCSLCHAVKEGRDQEQKGEVEKLVVKQEAVLAHRAVVPEPAVADWVYSLESCWIVVRGHAPPTPPPWA